MIFLFLTLASLFYHSKRVLYYLQILQQEDYEIKRFLRWCFGPKRIALDIRGSIYFGVSAFISHWPGLILILIGSKILNDPSTDAKLPLIMTERANRIYKTYLIILGILLFLFIRNPMMHFLFIPLMPFLLVVSVQVLASDEQRRQNQYIENAKEIYEKIAPFTIGITGSYGKTSVKHLLGPLVQVSLGNAQWTQGGINSIMGITREIQDRYFPGLTFSVMEMGAYRIGSIAKVCELVRPKAAIITAVGECHLERFKNQEAILKAKSELAIAVPQEGILVVNGDNPGARTIGEIYPKNTTLFYGLENKNSKLDCFYQKYAYDKYGMIFTINYKGHLYSGYTKFLGPAALSNILAVFSMCMALGADGNYVLATLAHLKPFNNRLQLEVTSDVIYLHDGYNSNPDGFESALEVLEKLEKDPQGRRMLMTPGMIELGDKQFFHNFEIAKKAAKICDLIILVGDTNAQSWIQGIKESGYKGRFIHSPHRDNAFKEFHQLKRVGDILLIENDLPDIYETPWRY